MQSNDGGSFLGIQQLRIVNSGIGHLSRILGIPSQAPFFACLGFKAGSSCRLRE